MVLKQLYPIAIHKSSVEFGLRQNKENVVLNKWTFGQWRDCLIALSLSCIMVNIAPENVSYKASHSLLLVRTLCMKVQYQVAHMPLYETLKIRKNSQGHAFTQLATSLPKYTINSFIQLGYSSF